MKHPFRTALMHVVVWPYALLSFVSFGVFMLVALPFLRFMKMRHRYLDGLRRSFDSIRIRRDRLVAEADGFAELPPEVRARIREDLKVLNAERAMLRKSVKWRPLFSSVELVVGSTCEFLGRGLERRQQRIAALQTILKGFERDTFVSELIVWLVWPTARSENMLGDLLEEYEGHRAKLGDHKAATWMRQQVWGSVRELLWQRLDRILALAALTELLHRLFGK